MIGFEKKATTGRIPVFGPNAEQAPGGYLLVIAGFAVGSLIAAGTPLVLDDAARTATVLNFGVIQLAAGASATAYRVNKGHTLTVGMNLAGATGNKAYPITAIDTSNAGYDELTVGTTIGSAALGDLVFASTTTGASNSALPAVNGLLWDDTYVAAKTDVSAVIRGTVYARRVPYNASIAAAPGLRHLLYIQSR